MCLVKNRRPVSFLFRQARDFDNPELKVAVKVFRIRKRKNRSKGPLHEISRLQRRLRWETAILKYAPRDISSYVWSQLAHLVMPLDIVEPVDKLELSDGDMRYWHQWVLFESFAGRSNSTRNCEERCTERVFS